MKKKDTAKASGKEKLFTPGMKKALIVLLCIYFAVVAVIIGYSIWEKPPEVTPPVSAADPTPTPEQTGENTGAEEDENPEEGEALETKRSDGVYTAAVVGRDAASGSTDTILVARFDTNKHEIDVVSIPRDTLVNISWSKTPKKINAIYAGYENSGLDGMDGLREYLATLMGFEVDCYALIDVQAFVDIIDAMGGVYYDVPIDMHYFDPTQDLTINVSKGYQLLDGYDAMGVFRFRSGYANADLGRIEVQQDFLLSIADQFLTLGNIPNLGKIIDILDQRVETNLTAANMAYFARQFLKCDMEDIEFHTAPVSGSYFGGISYVSLNVDSWLEMVNECLNPYDREITESDVDILVANYDGSYIYATSGVIAGGMDSFVDLTGGKDEEPPVPSEEPSAPEGGEENVETAPEGGTEPDTETQPEGEGEAETGTETAPEPETEPQPETETQPAPENSGGTTQTTDTTLSNSGETALSNEDSELYDQLMEYFLLEMMMNSGMMGLGQ